MDQPPSAEIVPPDVLFADDDPEDQELFCQGMQEIYPHVRIKLFLSGEALLKYLNAYSLPVLPKCILFEYQMPGLLGVEVLQALGFLPQFKEVPKIVWTTLAFEKEINECLNLGATRVSIKPSTYSGQKEMLLSLYRDFIEITPSSPGASEETGEATA